MSSAEDQDEARRETIAGDLHELRGWVRNALEHPEELNPRTLIGYVRRLPHKSPRVVYNLACCYSLAAQDDPEQAEAYLEIAWESLRRSISRSPPLERRGLLEHASDDPDLKALRDARPDEFEQLWGLVPGSRAPAGG